MVFTILYITQINPDQPSTMPKSQSLCIEQTNKQPSHLPYVNVKQKIAFKPYLVKTMIYFYLISSSQNSLPLWFEIAKYIK